MEHNKIQNKTQSNIGEEGSIVNHCESDPETDSSVAEKQSENSSKPLLDKQIPTMSKQELTDENLYSSKSILENPATFPEDLEEFFRANSHDNEQPRHKKTNSAEENFIKNDKTKAGKFLKQKTEDLRLGSKELTQTDDALSKFGSHRILRGISYMISKFGSNRILRRISDIKRAKVKSYVSDGFS